VPSPLRPDEIPSARTACAAVRWSKRYRRGVAVTDLLVVAVAATVGSVLAAERAGSWIGLAAPLVLVVAWSLALLLCRTRSPRRMAVGAEEYKRVVLASAATAGVLGVLAVLVQGAGSPAVRAHLLVSLPLGLLGLLAGRWVWRTRLHLLRRRGVALSDVVVVGQEADIDYVARQIARRSAVCYRVVGRVIDMPAGGGAVGGTSAPASGDDPSSARPTGPGPLDGIPTAQGMDRVPDLVAELGADAVLVAGQLAGGTAAIRSLGWALEPAHTELVLVSSLVNVAGPRITMRPVEGLPLMHVDQPRFEGGRHVVKRVLDVVVASLALLAMLPLFAVLAVLIRRDSGGPVFFSQTRNGRHGETFRMHKFRTMVTTAERDRAALVAANQGAGPLFKMKDDPRVTHVGAVLRRHSLDELPQFWNVLKGEMSLVGPRPPLPEEVASYEGHTGRRLYIKPGLTGLWQINGRSNLDWEESVRLDLYYVENWSVTGDLMIMWRTFKVMVRPEGAY
jgi:exopolysaccharide biosynthesis polyprenyl glycosylphosphotransferase